MYRSSPFRNTLNTGYITALDMWSMYRSSPFRSTLNTGYITALDMCEVCTEAVHSIAPWTRVTSQLWTSVKYEPPSDTFGPYFHNHYTLLCLKDDFTFTFPRGLIWKFDNPSTTLSLAPGKFDNPYKGAESAGCLKQRCHQRCRLEGTPWFFQIWVVNFTAS